MGKPIGFDNPYPRCHNVLFNISDENWQIIEIEFLLYKKDPTHYQFPSKPLGDSIISKQHEEALKSMFKELDL